MTVKKTFELQTVFNGYVITDIPCDIHKLTQGQGIRAKQYKYLNRYNLLIVLGVGKYRYQLKKSIKLAAAFV